jgi:hypothetical protein
LLVIIHRGKKELWITPWPQGRRKALCRMKSTNPFSITDFHQEQFLKEGVPCMLSRFRGYWRPTCWSGVEHFRTPGNLKNHSGT